MFKKGMVALCVLGLLASVQAWAADIPTFFPKDAMILVGANVSKILEVPQAKEAFEKSKTASNAVQGPKSYDGFVKTFGFNPEKEVKNAFLVMPAQGTAGKPPEPSFIVIQGTFNEAKIIEAAQKSEEFKKESELIKIEGLNAVKDKSSKENLVGVFLDAATFVLGPEENVKKAIAIKAGKEKGIMDNPVFAAGLKKVDTNATVWGLAIIPAEMKADLEKNAAGTPMAAVSALSNVQFSVNTGTDLDVSIVLAGEKKEAVDALFATIDGSLAMAKTGSMIPLATDALNLIKLINLKKEAETIQVTFKGEIKKIEEAVKAMSAMNPGMPPMGGGMPPQMEPPASPNAKEPAPAAEPKVIPPADDKGDEENADEEKKDE